MRRGSRCVTDASGSEFVKKGAPMFERLNTPDEIFSFKLGAALKMEQTILEMLPELAEHAQREELKQAIRQHEQETRRHVENIEQAFRQLGEEPDDSPCPAIDG